MGSRAFRVASVLFGGAFLIAIFFVETRAIQAQIPQFNILKPSTTGIPGEEVRIMKFDPAGNLWVVGRHYFWGETGLAMLSADQLAHEALPGGGFDTGAWKVWSNVHHPIPSVYSFDLEFSADGNTLWLGTEGGLVRFRPNAATPGEMWKTYSTANTPMQIEGIASVAIDNAGNIWVVNNNVQNYPSAELYKLNPSTEQWTHVPVQSGSTIWKPYAVSVTSNGDLLVSRRTFAGLARYNGTSWTLIGGGSALGTPLEDTQGNIWGISSAGLWKWNGSTWRNWESLGGTTDMNALGIDRNGVVHVGNWYGQFYKIINDEAVPFLNAGSIPSSFIGRPNGEIWIHNYGGNGVLGTVRHYSENGQLLERFNNYNAGLGDYFVERIKADSQGNLWFASGEAGLTRMLGSDGDAASTTHWRNWGNHNDQAEPYPWAGNEPMYSVLEDAGGIFWFGGNGVGRWNSNTGQFTNFWNWQNSNIDTAGVKDIVKRGDTIWVGTGGSGVFWLNGNTWTRVTLSNPWNYVSNNVRAMTVDTAGNLWVASDFGLRRFAAGDNANYTLFHQDNSGIPDGNTNDVIADPNGGIWVATSKGLGRFDGTNWTTYNQANTGMPGVVVADVARRASDGMIAIASVQAGTFPYTGGVSTFDGQTWTHYTRDNSPLTHWQVVAVEFDKEGDLWASPTSEGLVEIKIGNAVGRRAPFDFDGDGKTDVSIFRPSDGSWWYSQSSDTVTRALVFGSATDRVAPVDFTGDGKTDIAFFRPGTGEWLVLRSEDNSFYSFPFGASGDIPHPADYDGDGRADPAVFRGGTWYIANSSGGTIIAHFGQAGDLPVAADYDADGEIDLAIYRPSQGQWWLRRSSAGTVAYQFGNSSDNAVAGDYTGDGKTDIALWRPATGEWFVLRSEDTSYYAVPFGTNGDIPTPGDYDGDGKFDRAIFRPGSSTWYLDRSTSGIHIQQFGSGGDQPIPNVFVR